jgi:hypothetical protein
MSSGSAAPKTRSSTSAIRCDVSTLPAATLAGGAAFTSERAGSEIVTAAMSPPPAGSGCSSRASTTHRDRRYSIHAAHRLRGRTGEVKLKTIRRHFHPHDNAQGTVAETVVIQHVFRLVCTVRNAFNAPPHQQVSVRDQGLHRGPRLRHAASPHDFQQPRCTRVERGELGGQVTCTLFRRPDIRQDKPPERFVALPASHQQHRWNAQTLLKDFPRQRHGARSHATHVRVVRPHREIRYYRTLHVHRRNKGNVRQVRTAREGIVQYRDVPIAQRAHHVECCAHTHRHRAQVHGHVIAHRYHPRLGIEQRARIVAPLLDVG